MRAVLPVLLTIVATCGPARQPGEDLPEVILEVEPRVAAPGAPVRLTLTNRSPGSLGYNLCTSALEVREDPGWEPVPSDRVCTMELRLLEPGAAADYPIDLPAGLAAGTYRFVTTVEHMDEGHRVRVVSAPFEVGD